MTSTRKWIVGSSSLAAAALAVVLAASPYRSHEGFPSRLIREAVEVAAPCERVHAYLGDSDNARDWSVYVDHITPLNADRVPDGARGSVRRSFKLADESGMRWDEYFELVEPLRRRLTVYNVRGAPAPSGELLTEQIYEPLDDEGCRVSFTLFLREDPSLADAVLMRIGAWDVARIFRANLGNVKRLLEARPSASVAVP